jgi:hypothetical protein
LAIQEIERLRSLRSAELFSLRSLARAPGPFGDFDDLEIRAVDAQEVAPILGGFHYLRYPRRDAVSVAAFLSGRVAAVCSFSSLDLPAIKKAVPLSDPAQAAVLSRVFAFDWAPRNVISFMLARIGHSRIAIGDGIRLLITYVDPNMGFSGASYRASNWLPFGVEVGTRYAYLDDRYITKRELERLPLRDRMRTEYSKMPLHPLNLLCFFLDKRLRRAHPRGFDFVFQRP